jgi:hypothetical protein
MAMVSRVYAAYEAVDEFPDRFAPASDLRRSLKLDRTKRQTDLAALDRGRNKKGRDGLSRLSPLYS